MIKKPFRRPMIALFPTSQRRRIDPELNGEPPLGQAVDSSIFPNLVSKVLCLLLKRVTVQEFDNLRNLGQRRVDSVPFPKVDRDI